MGADPCSSQFLHSAGACLSSKHKQGDKKQKHQQERDLTAKLCRNQMSFFRACLLSPGKLGLLHLCLGVREHLPPRKKPGLGQVLAMVSVGFLVMGLCNHSHVYSMMCNTTQDSHKVPLWQEMLPEDTGPPRVPCCWAQEFLLTSSVDVIALHQINLGSFFFPKAEGYVV